MPRRYAQYMVPQRELEIRRAPSTTEQDALDRLRALGAQADVQQKGRPAGYSRNAVKPRHVVVRTPDRVIRVMLKVTVEGRERTVELSELERAENLLRGCR